MVVELGPHPLCEQCRQRNGELVSVRHRQVHVWAHGKGSCVDLHLVGIMARLWEVCDTTSSCQDHGGRAYVVPTAETAAAAERFLRQELGLDVEADDGVLYFRLPEQVPVVLPAQSTAAAQADRDPDLLTDLYDLRNRLAIARGRLVEATQGVDQSCIRAARNRIGYAGDFLTRAMEAHSYAAGRPEPRADLALRAAQILVLVCLVWPVAALVSHVTSGSVTWTASAAVVVVSAVSHPMGTRVTRLRGWWGRRRLTAALRARGLATPAWQERPPRQVAVRFLCHELDEVEELVEQVRSAIGSAAQRYLIGHPSRPPDTGAGVQWLRQRDAVMAALAPADAELTCALDAIGRWWKEPTG